jgi:glycosyltransferase involved in cell wall biosynthesis
MLMLASVASMIDQFNMPNIEILRGLGYEVHVAANFEYGNTSSKQRVEEFKKELEEIGIPYYHVGFARNITKIFTNIKAYKQITALMLENKYEFVHCHSPIGGVCGRLAAHSTKTKVIYTAHGFHFFKGAPLENWLIYYPVERFLARYTEILITINKEDYARAKKSFTAKKVVYVPGVGVDTQKFGGKVVDREGKHKELGIHDGSVVLLSVGELIKRKNHETAIRAVANINDLKLVYLICGRGDLDGYLKDLIKNLGIENRVRFLGFRKDISEICSASDMYVFPSYQEGLSVALMEAMAAGLPVVCSNIRGNTDLIEDGKGGYLCQPDDINGFAKAINMLAEDKKLRKQMARNNIEAVRQFDVENVKRIMKSIYANVSNDAV